MKCYICGYIHRNKETVEIITDVPRLDMRTMKIINTFSYRCRSRNACNIRAMDGGLWTEAKLRELGAAKKIKEQKRRYIRSKKG